MPDKRATLALLEMLTGARPAGVVAAVKAGAALE
jgi:hypothetical protein